MEKLLALFALLGLLGGGCAAVPVVQEAAGAPSAPSLRLHDAPVVEGFAGPPPAFSSGRDEHALAGEQLAAAAVEVLQRRRRLVRNDCSGLLETVFAQVGVEGSGPVHEFWRRARDDGRVHYRDVPAPGDLVFFDATYDQNRNGRVDDELTHIAVVVEIEDSGTVVMVHKGRAGVQELRMNLAAPDVFDRDGRVLNDYLRAPGYGPARGPRLTGELFRAFARPPPASDDDSEPREVGPVS